MSLLQKVKKVTIKKDIGIVSFVNEEGNSTHVLYLNKPIMLKDEDFQEIMESLEIRFKKKL